MWRHLTGFTIQSTNLWFCRLEIDKIGKSKHHSLGNRAAYFRIRNNLMKTHSYTQIILKQSDVILDHVSMCIDESVYTRCSLAYIDLHIICWGKFSTHRLRICVHFDRIVICENLCSTLCAILVINHTKNGLTTHEACRVCVCFGFVFVFVSRFLLKILVHYLSSWVCVSCSIPTRKFVGSVYDRYFKPLKCPCALLLLLCVCVNKSLCISAVYKCIFYDPANVFPFEMCVLFRRHYYASDAEKRHR